MVFHEAGSSSVPSTSSSTWSQRFAVILNGVMYFFVDTTAADQFKMIVARGDEGVFVAAQFAEGTVVSIIKFL
jgi:hypothetical protein